LTLAAQKQRSRLGSNTKNRSLTVATEKQRSRLRNGRF